MLLPVFTIPTSVVLVAASHICHHYLHHMLPPFHMGVSTARTPAPLDGMVVRHICLIKISIVLMLFLVLPEDDFPRMSHWGLV